MQHAVDAVAHPQVVLRRLDVDVGRAVRIAWVISRFTNLTIGASSTTSGPGQVLGLLAPRPGRRRGLPGRRRRGSTGRWPSRSSRVATTGRDSSPDTSGRRPRRRRCRVGHRQHQPPVRRSRSAAPCAAGRPPPDQRHRRASTAYSVEVDEGSPICWASAATSWVSVSTPCSTRTRPSCARRAGARRRRQPAAARRPARPRAGCPRAASPPRPPPAGRGRPAVRVQGWHARVIGSWMAGLERCVSSELLAQSGVPIRAACAATPGTRARCAGAGPPSRRTWSPRCPGSP